MKYLITGGAGYLGSVVVHELARRGYQPITVLALPNENISNLLDLKIEIVRGDILDYEFLEQLIEKDDVVFHMAGIINISSKSDDLIRKVNVEGCRNIVDVCIKKQVKRLIYTSSVHTILPAEKNENMSEPEAFYPDKLVGEYAQTKAIATDYLLKKARSGALDAVVLYPSGIIGPFDYQISHFGQVVLDYINRKLSAIVKGGYNFVDVRDVADGVISAYENGKSGEGYLLSGEYITVKEIFQTLNEKLGRKKLPYPIALWFLKIVAPLAELHYKIRKKKPIFSSYSLYTLNVNSNFDNTKAKNELNFNPRPVKLSLGDMVDWFIENKSGMIKPEIRNNIQFYSK